LKEGEALLLKKKGGWKFPKLGDTVYVYRVLDSVVIAGLDSGHQTTRHDFTALLVDDDGEVAEFAFDSRFFERIAS